MSDQCHFEYKAYHRELKQLRDTGVGLFCPEGIRITPKSLARYMAYDTKATYMRDAVTDSTGEVVAINFMRVELR